MYIFPAYIYAYIPIYYSILYTMLIYSHFSVDIFFGDQLFIIYLLLQNRNNYLASNYTKVTV